MIFYERFGFTGAESGIHGMTAGDLRRA
jgi:hypothetical protein